MINFNKIPNILSMLVSCGLHNLTFKFLINILKIIPKTNKIKDSKLNSFENQTITNILVKTC